LLLLGFYLGWLAPPYVGGLWYSLCGGHHYEQQWLDKAILHLKDMRAHCDDPDLAGILDYTITRYHRVGAWDVMMAPCVGMSTIGINTPHCPGLTIDPEVLTWPSEMGALVVVHEAMHNFPPYYGHSHITTRESRLRELSLKVR
jgi:hypothetical protein